MSVSFWWRSLGGMPAPRPPLPIGGLACDVAIAGGGYTGLWTALSLKRADPALRVVVLEREVCGFGASGRNGGWLSGLLAGSRARWAAACGRDAVVRFQREMFRTVDEVAAAGIDCDLVKAGSLRVATSAPQLRRLQSVLAEERAWGFGEEDWRGMSADELDERVRVAGAVGALFTPHCARVHPAKLVRGLAAACEAEGVEVFERTPVIRLAPHVAATPFGSVRARWVVRATEGYSPGLRGLRRAVVPLNSAMIVTAPLPAEEWARLGWDGCETMLDGAHVYCYLQRTADGRIAIGGRGVPYRYGSRTDRAGEIAPRTVRELHQRLGRLLPTAASAPVADAWAGVLGVARDWCPSVGIDRRRGMAWAGGYVGDGVSTANLAGRTLRDLILGVDSDLVGLPWVNWRVRSWEPEPLRYLGIHAVYGAYRGADRLEERTGRPSRLARVAGRVSGR